MDTYKKIIRLALNIVTMKKLVENPVSALAEEQIVNALRAPVAVALVEMESRKAVADLVQPPAEILSAFRGGE